MQYGVGMGKTPDIALPRHATHTHTHTLLLAVEVTLVAKNKQRLYMIHELRVLKV